MSIRNIETSIVNNRYTMLNRKSRWLIPVWYDSFDENEYDNQPEHYYKSGIWQSIRGDFNDSDHDWKGTPLKRLRGKWGLALLQRNFYLIRFLFESSILVVWLFYLYIFLGTSIIVYLTISSIVRSMKWYFIRSPSTRHPPSQVIQKARLKNLPFEDGGVQVSPYYFRYLW